MAVHFPQNKVNNGAYDGDRLPTMSPGPTRILILGGGFGGVYSALTLEQLLRLTSDAGLSSSRWLTERTIWSFSRCSRK